MDRFQAMQVFTRVVEANSFTLAADTLGLPRSTITTTIQALERQLRTKLLNRTTRRLSLTPDGASYYERCLRILADVEDAEASLHDTTHGPRGRLRVDTLPSMGRLILIPALCDFHTRYPDIELAIGMSDRPIDLVQDAVDCVVRVGELKGPTLVGKRIGTLEIVTCAAPAYIERYGEPTTIQELDQHRAVHYFSSATGKSVEDWNFSVDDKPVDVSVNGIISVNDSEAYLTCGLQGFGMIQLPRYMVTPYLQTGELREVLAQWAPAPMPISVAYLYNRHLSPKVRVFVDWVSELFQKCPRMRDCTDGKGYSPECAFGSERKGGSTIRDFLVREGVEESTF
ncbi:MAG: LysR family transcriptional regulator [Alcaligenaceae bacterium]|nr:LysR family transcriptional regulator [Alcaligenaceae bacterium]